MSFVERFIILCPYLGESTIRGSTVCDHSCIEVLKAVPTTVDLVYPMTSVPHIFVR